MGLPGLSSARGSGTAFPVLGLPSDGPGFMEFRPHGLKGTFTDIRNLVGPAGDSEPDRPVLRDEFGLPLSESKTDSGAGTLHVGARSSFAWPVFLGNLGLGSGWPWLGSGGP